MEDAKIDLNLIPFGLNENSGELLDVSDVPKGRKCGCICPSCKTPLIARKGKVNVWHFAHASRSVYSKTERECELSFYVSVRMMARQIIGSELELDLPEYVDFVKDNHPYYDDLISLPFLISEQQSIILSDVKVEQYFLGTNVDVMGDVMGYAFIIYFTHPSRDIPLELLNARDSKIGIISISLTELPTLFFKHRRSGASYQTILFEYLTSDIASKQWVFHPRYKRKKEEAREILDQQIAQLKTCAKHEAQDNTILEEKSTYMLSVTEAPVRRLANFECVQCHVGWQDWDPSGSVCPACNTHLFRTLKSYVDDKR